MLCNPFSPGGDDSACPRHPHCAHPRSVSAPSLSPARQGLHPLVALLAVPAVYGGPPPSSADLWGLPSALLPQGRLQAKRAISHLCIQHALSRDGVHDWWAGVRTAEQRLLVPQPLPHPPYFFSPNVDSGQKRLTNTGDRWTDRGTSGLGSVLVTRSYWTS